MLDNLVHADQLNVIVSLPAGSGLDVHTRLFMKRYDELYGTQTVVHNRPGAEGTIAVNAMQELPKNSLLFPVLGHITGLKEVEYKKIVPVVELSRQPLILIARKNLPVNTWDEFVAYSKKNQLNVGIASRASTVPFVLAFNERNGIEQQFIYYSAGAARGELDVVSGNLDLYWVTPPVMLSVADRVKVLAVTGPAGSVPSIDNTVPNSSDPRIGSHFIHYGVFASADMDPALRQKLTERLGEIASSQWARDTFRARGVIMVGGKQEPFAKLVDSNWRNWQQLMPKYAENKQ